MIAQELIDALNNLERGEIVVELEGNTERMLILLSETLLSFGNSTLVRVVVMNVKLVY